MVNVKKSQRKQVNTNRKIFFTVKHTFHPHFERFSLNTYHTDTDTRFPSHYRVDKNNRRTNSIKQLRRNNRFYDPLVEHQLALPENLQCQRSWQHFSSNEFYLTSTIIAGHE